MANATEPDDEQEMATVTSADGTEIAYERSGSGPPVVLVHGSTVTHTHFDPVRPAFADYFTVYAMDRRGHGESGVADEYALEREAEDVSAVIDGIQEPVTLLGSSFGALVSLEAALQTENLRALVLYEPPIPVGDHEFAEYEKVAALVENGENEQALTVLHNLGEDPPVQIDALREQPNWQKRVDGAHTFPRETRVFREYAFDPARFMDVTTPSLLLTGSESSAAFQDAMEAVEEALPNSRLITFEGHGHVAFNTAPDRFIDEVLSFVREST